MPSKMPAWVIDPVSRIASSSLIFPGADRPLLAEIDAKCEPRLDRVRNAHPPCLVLRAARSALSIHHSTIVCILNRGHPSWKFPDVRGMRLPRRSA
jgi:hypothetical protein